jgi:hypothetical protein
MRGKKGELLPRQKYAELLTSSSQAVIIVSRLRRNIQHIENSYRSQVEVDFDVEGVFHPLAL